MLRWLERTQKEEKSTSEEGIKIKSMAIRQDPSIQ
jgi:hypothetical protein